MERKASKYAITFAVSLLAVILILTALSGTMKESKKDANLLLLPSLPRPIAKEYALITSAGQNIDAYIVRDAADKLMIHNYFMPQAEEADLEGINTLVFVVGYSSTGEKLHGTSYENEKKRIQGLLDKAEKANLVKITVYIAGEHSHDKNSEELLGMVASKSDYIIATKAANENDSISGLLKGNRIPVTFINGPKNLSEPFASAFR
jgi:hypothetical protein